MRIKIFSNDEEGIFISRPNRFIVTAKTQEGIIRAHCPNPGRLQEILIPGRRLIFEKSSNPERRTTHTLAAAYYKGKIIPLYSAAANKIVRDLVLPILHPEADSVFPEQKWGKSRFDFLVTERGEKAFIEVKACSLVEDKRGMFPDAPTSRGKRHLEELIDAGKAGFKTEVIFVITHPDAGIFTPNIHTDPAFSLTLREAGKTVRIHAVSIECTALGFVSVKNSSIPVDLVPVELIEKNTGAYLILTELKKSRTISIGKLGTFSFNRGFYVYTGSGRGNLTSRIKRHENKKKKNLRWHIDYLTVKADRIRSFPVYNSGDIECLLSRDMEAIGGSPVPGFGSSDCGCLSHLFHFKKDPVITDPFQKILHRYRHDPMNNRL